jgi:hypothetical protein
MCGKRNRIYVEGPNSPFIKSSWCWKLAYAMLENVSTKIYILVGKVKVKVSP